MQSWWSPCWSLPKVFFHNDYLLLRFHEHLFHDYFKGWGHSLTFLQLSLFRCEKWYSYKKDTCIHPEASKPSLDRYPWGAYGVFAISPSLCFLQTLPSRKEHCMDGLNDNEWVRTVTKWNTGLEVGLTIDKTLAKDLRDQKSPKSSMSLVWALLLLKRDSFCVKDWLSVQAPKEISSWA